MALSKSHMIEKIKAGNDRITYVYCVALKMRLSGLFKTGLSEPYVVFKICK